MLKPASKTGHWKLIDSRHNRNVESWEASGREVTPSCPADWSVKKFRLHGGKQEGVDVIAVDNGKLVLTVVPTRGMGILEVKMGEIRLGWDSPVKEVVNPAFINLQGRGDSAGSRVSTSGWSAAVSNRTARPASTSSSPTRATGARWR